MRTNHGGGPEPGSAISIVQLRSIGGDAYVVVLEIGDALNAFGVDVRHVDSGAHIATVVEPDLDLMAEFASRPFTLARLASVIGDLARDDGPRLPARVDDPRDCELHAGHGDGEGIGNGVPGELDDLDTLRFEIGEVGPRLVESGLVP